MTGILTLCSELCEPSSQGQPRVGIVLLFLFLITYQLSLSASQPELIIPPHLHSPTFLSLLRRPAANKMSFRPTCLLFLSILAAVRADLVVPLTKVGLVDLLVQRKGVIQREHILDALMAFGNDVHTMKVGIGTPRQEVDALVDVLGQTHSQTHPGLTFVADVACARGTECDCKDTFNASASSSYISRHEDSFSTGLNSGNGVALNVHISGPYGEEELTYSDQGYSSSTVHESRFGRATSVEGALFNGLPFDAVVSMSRKSALFTSPRGANQMFSLNLPGEKLRLGTTSSPECYSQALMADLLKLDTISEYFAFTVDRMGIKKGIVSIDVDCGKGCGWKVTFNPNSPFVQGPADLIATVARVFEAEKLRLGTTGMEFYTVPCDDKYEPLTLGLDIFHSSDLSIPMNRLNIQLGEFLPKGQCLWALQEMPASIASLDWMLGKPFAQQYCIGVSETNMKFQKIISS